jgi:hypothetical protein
MRRLESGLAKRTHGVRPSEKTAFAPSRGLSPLAKPRWGRPRRGGAGSARPLKNAWAWPRHDPSRPLGVRLPLREHVVHRFASGQSLRTRRPRPSEKITLHIIPWFSPKASHSGLPPRRGGLRTPAKNPPLIKQLVEQGNPHQTIGFWPIVAR